MPPNQTIPLLGDMRKLVAIDPGSRSSGVAVFDFWPLLEPPYWRLSEAVACTIGPAEDSLEMAAQVFQFVGCPDATTYTVSEYPEEQPYRREFVRQNDIIMLAHTTGLILSRLQPDPRRLSRIFPDTWKGRVPKPGKARRRLRGPLPYIIEERCRRILQPKEIERVLLPNSSRWKDDVWDAIGLGLWAVSRCRRGCVPK